MADLEGARDVCATGVDGTSIDVLTDLAVAFGLNARQLVVPPEHLVSGSLGLLPAVVVTELPGSLLHFMVVWRRIGRWVMVLDPAVGRRWMRIESLLASAYHHEMPVDPAAWRGYAESDAFIGPLLENLAACGVSDARRVVDEALGSAGVAPIARLDAAARRAARAGRGARRRFAELRGMSWEELGSDSMVVADPASGVGGDGEPVGLLMRGVVVLSVDGVDHGVEVPGSLAGRVLVDSPSPWSVLVDLLGAGGTAVRLVVSMVALLVGSVASIAATYVLGELAGGVDGSDPGRRWAALGLVGAAAVLSVAGMWGVLSRGRAGELELRSRLERRVGRLPVSFFASRPSSDLAERVHAMHRLREVPVSVAELVISAGHVVAATAVLVVLSPGAWWSVVVLLAAATVPPILALSAMTEREHRSRTIAGALSHTYLDSLLGALPVRAHRAQAAVRSEHGDLLDGWVLSERSRHRFAGGFTGVALGFGYLAAVLVVVTAAPPRSSDPADVALVAFLSFVVVNAAFVAVRTLRVLAPQWVVAQRLMSLSTAELDPLPAEWHSDDPARVELRSVTVDGAGGPVLRDVDLTIGPGEHVAIVGASGAGKSTLVAAMLGWAVPSAGQVLVDGELLDPARAVALRQRCGWVDPDAAIWSGTLADNVEAAGSAPDDWLRWMEPLGLGGVVDRLGGIHGEVGESGRLLSGGEAQRLRIARLVNRPGNRLVVLDEVTRGLDPALRASVLSTLVAVTAGVTTVWVTHDLDEACSLGRVVLVDDGRVVADGAPAELLADPDNAFTKMMHAHRALDASFGADSAWTVAHLDHGRLTVPAVRRAHTTHANTSTSDALLAGGHDADTVGSATSRGGPELPAGERSRRTALGRIAIAAAVLAAVAVAAEWSLFLTGWSQMLSADRSPWWPLMFVVAAVAAGCAVWLLGMSALRLGAWLRRRLLDGGMEMSVDDIRSAGSGDLIGRVLEAEMFEQQAVTGSTDMLVGVAQIAAAYVVLRVADGPTAVATLGAVWLVALVIVATGADRTRRRWSQERIARSRALLERFRGHRTESVYGIPSRYRHEHLAEYDRVSRHADRWRAMLIVNADLWLLAGVVVATVAASGRTLLAGLGAVVLCWSGFSSVGPALEQLVSARAAGEQFRTLLPRRGQARTATPHRTDTGPVRVTMRGVGYRYVDPRDGTVNDVLDDVDLDLGAGERIVLRGGSGSGKSTLGTVMSGLRRPTSGSVSGARRVLYVPQYGDNHAFQASLEFNLLLGRGWPPRRSDMAAADEVLDELGLGEVVANMPRGVAQPIGESGWQLSHGERGRLYLARALLQAPEVIVLDESLEGLDPDTTRRTLDCITRRVPTVVLISHR